MGGHELGKLTLEYLIKKNKNIIGVVTPDTDSKWYKGVDEIAKKYNIYLYENNNINTDEFIDKIKNMNPNLIVSVNFNQIIGKEIINIPNKGCINTHASSLPKYRGRAPLNWAIINGEKKTGVTVHYIDEGVDTGDIILQKEIAIKKDDYIKDILNKVKNNYPVIVNKAINQIKKGQVNSKPQNNKEGFYCGKRNPKDGKIDWEQSAKDIYNLIRAVSHPYPGAFTFLDDKKVMIWRAKVIKGNKSKAKPGEVIKKDNNNVLVQCKENQLLITDYDSEKKICTGDIFYG